MTVGEILDGVLKVFLPVSVVSGALVYLATRAIADDRSRRQHRWMLGAASLVLAGVATAYYWAYTGTIGGPSTEGAMTVADFLGGVLKVFLPVSVVSGALVYFATRAIGDDRSRRQHRWMLGAAPLVLAGVATAYHWACRGKIGGRESWWALLLSLAVPLVTYLAIVLLDNWLSRRVEDDAMRLKLRKAFIYAGVLVVLATLVKVWLLREQVNYTTVFSVVGAGLALALHQVILCFTGWVFLMVQHHYDVGDRVQIGEVKGDVSDIGIFHTMLVEIGNWVDADQSTGRLVAVPNSAVFTQSIFNYTRGFEYIWNEIRVLVTFESNWRKAQRLMLDLAQEGVEELQEKFRTQIRKMARKYMILYQHVTPIVYPRILDSGVQLTLRYLCPPKRRRGTEAELTAKILDAFAAEPDIDFAYPTTRFYDATREGKADRPPLER